MKKAVLLAILAALAAVSRADDKVDFAKQIKPLLEKRCIECHGPKKVKGELRLDTKDAALKGGESGNTIVAGKADDSLVVKRISLPEGHDDIMPPKGDPLTKEQIDLIKKWINDGAHWPDGLAIGVEEEKAAAVPAKPGPGQRRKAAGKEFAALTPTADKAAEQEAIKKLAGLGVSVRPIAQNLEWKEATVRPQDTNKNSEAVALLKDIPSLVDLNLANLRLKDDDLKSIANLKNLQRLHLENNPITDAALAHVKGLVNLEYLNLYNTQVGDEGIKNLTGLTNLTAVYLWQTKVTDEAAAELKKTLPDTYINRGEELKLLAKVEEKKAEEKKAEEKKAEEKKEAKPEEKKEEKADAKKEEKKPEDKKPEEKKAEEKKAS
jgi:mono/diheme cytochrome c family protein